MQHQLPALPDTVNWGYFDASLKPVLTVRSGDIVQIETVSHNAGHAPELSMDEGVCRIFDEVKERGPGAHIMTGPILVLGAEPGDTLEVRVLTMRPRVPYGSNNWTPAGLLYEDFQKRRRITIYGFDRTTTYARAEFAFDVPEGAPRLGAVFPAESVKRVPALDKVAVPLRPHLGIGAVAPDQAGKISSTPPDRWGGNIDNWRFGTGTSMFYPVLVPGALYVAGDPHMAEGDGEISGTAIESSLDVTVQLTLHKDFPVTTQLLETPTHWMLHAYDPDLDIAMHQAGLETLRFLVDQRGLSKDDAYSLMSVAVDFVVTQVVDQNKGVHSMVPKSLFLP